MEFQKIKSYVINNKQVNTLPKQKNKSILYSDFLTSEANRYADYQQFFMSAVDALIYTDRLSLIYLKTKHKKNRYKTVASTKLFFLEIKIIKIRYEEVKKKEKKIA